MAALSFSSTLHLFLALLTTSILALPQSIQPSKRVLTPTTDPFYNPPSGFESTTPGTILRTRQVLTANLGLLPNLNVQSYQLLYRTTAINGSAIAAVTTIFKPLLAPQLDRFISFHTAYDGSSTLCNPSYNYQFLAPQLDVISDVEFLLLEAFLLKGYIVSSPDYEGPDAAFGAGRLAGMVALDSMRAVSSFQSLGFTTSAPQIVGYGYSGGSIATSWSASLHNSYAPDLPVLGWASGGTVANLTGTALFLDNTLFSGFLPPAIVGLSQPSSYAAQLSPLIDSIITPYGQSKLDFARENCIADLFNFAEMSVLDTKFQSLGDGFYYQEDIAEVMARQTLATVAEETPTVPLYVWHAEKDEIIPYDDAVETVDSWCQNGAGVEFVTFGSGGHFTTEILGFVGAFEFVERAFAGEVVPGMGCVKSSTLNDTLNPIALGADLEPILISLVDALAAFGRGDENVISNPEVLTNTTV